MAIGRAKVLSEKDQGLGKIPNVSGNTKCGGSQQVQG